MTAPKRRWFHFSLATMFVAVTAVALASGWTIRCLQWIRQRHEVVEQHFAVDYDFLEEEPPRDAPGLLWVFGESGYLWIELSFPVRRGWELSADQQSELERVKKLFPEARTEWRPTVVREQGDYDGFQM